MGNYGKSECFSSEETAIDLNGRVCSVVVVRVYLFGSIEIKFNNEKIRRLTLTCSEAKKKKKREI